MNNDSKTTIEKLKRLLSEFRDERSWAKFHDPKNLAEAISVEASELLESFLWKTPTEISNGMKLDPQFKKAIEEELADVICFSLSFTNCTNIDVSRIVTEKIATNLSCYPF